MIVNVNVAGEQRVIGGDDMVSQLAIVRNVAAGHQEVMVADAGDALFLFRGPIDGDATRE